MIDNNEYCGRLLTELSKVFDCVKYMLIILITSALALIHSYLSERKQRTQIILPSAYGMTYLLEYHKVLTWDLYCLMYISMIYFIKIR